MLEILEYLARRWLDWRQDRRIENARRENPQAFEWKLKKLEFNGHGWNLVAFAPTIVQTFAEEGAALLEGMEAPNYVQWDMMPRLDRKLRPIRITVQWAHGESPSEQNARLKSELAELREKLEVQDAHRFDSGDGAPNRGSAA